MVIRMRSRGGTNRCFCSCCAFSFVVAFSLLRTLDRGLTEVVSLSRTSSMNIAPLMSILRQVDLPRSEIHGLIDQSLSPTFTPVNASVSLLLLDGGTHTHQPSSK